MGNGCLFFLLHWGHKRDLRRRMRARRAVERQRRRVEDEQRRGGLGHACAYPLCDCPPSGPCGASPSIYEDPREAM